MEAITWKDGTITFKTKSGEIITEEMTNMEKVIYSAGVKFEMEHGINPTKESAHKLGMRQIEKRNILRNDKTILRY